MKAFHIIAGLAFFFLGAQSSLAQVGRYDKTHAVGKKSFNYLTEDTRKQKTHNNKGCAILSSQIVTITRHTLDRMHSAS